MLLYSVLLGLSFRVNWLTSGRAAMRCPVDPRALRLDAAACRPGRSVGNKVQHCAASLMLLRDEALCSADGTGLTQPSRRSPCCGLHCYQLPGNKLLGRTRGHGRASCTRDGVDRGRLRQPAGASAPALPTRQRPSRPPRGCSLLGQRFHPVSRTFWSELLFHKLRHFCGVVQNFPFSLQVF